jgi:flagellin-like hook-associated protein FlgL
MNTSVANIGFGILPTLITNAGTVHAQLNTLSEQASSGLVAQTYAGLGTSASQALNLAPQIAALQTYNANITQATGIMQVAQTALSQIQQIANQFVAEMPKLDGQNPSDVDNVAAQARDALGQVAQLLDTNDGGLYVFSGQDSANPPVPNPDQILSSNFFTQIQAAVAGLSTNGASATAAATLSIAQSNASGTSPFSAYLSQPVSAISPRMVQTSDSTIMPVGLIASANTEAISQGTSTTGSYMRDFLRALATIGSLSSSQSTDPNFGALIQDTTTSLKGAADAMAVDAGVLGNRQTQLTGLQTQVTNMTTALTGQISTIQDADMPTVLSQLTTMQTQLQISYRMIVNTSTLSLANYIPM